MRFTAYAVTLALTQHLHFDEDDTGNIDDDGADGKDKEIIRKTYVL